MTREATYYPSDTYFLNALRDLLGFCPLPGTREAAAEYDAMREPNQMNTGWYLGGLRNGNRQVRTTTK